MHREWQRRQLEYRIHLCERSFKHIRYLQPSVLNRRYKIHRASFRLALWFVR